MATAFVTRLAEGSAELHTTIAFGDNGEQQILTVMEVFGAPSSCQCIGLLLININS